MEKKDGFVAIIAKRLMVFVLVSEYFYTRFFEFRTSYLSVMFNLKANYIFTDPISVVFKHYFMFSSIELHIRIEV